MNPYHTKGSQTMLDQQAMNLCCTLSVIDHRPGYACKICLARPQDKGWNVRNDKILFLTQQCSYFDRNHP